MQSISIIDREEWLNRLADACDAIDVSSLTNEELVTLTMSMESVGSAAAVLELVL